MKRSIIMSMLVIGALATLIGAGTWATFTDSGTATGDVTAGTVDVVLNDDGSDDVELTFTPGSDPECPDNMAYNETCTAGLTVANNGSLSVTYDVTVTDSQGACFTSVLDIEAALETGDGGEGEGGDSDHNAGDSHDGTVTTTLDSDDDSCQGVTNTVTVTVLASQSPSPHD